MIKKILIYSLLLIVFIGCSGSDSYRGKWFAMTPNGSKLILIFKDNTLTETNGTKSQVYKYKQFSYANAMGGSKIYGIRINGKDEFKINFPDKSNDRFGLILDKNDNIIYSINRANYVNTKDIKFQK